MTTSDPDDSAEQYESVKAGGEKKDLKEKSLSPFTPTSLAAQTIALRFLALSEHDVVFDIGCGDARLLIAAASQVQGLKCVGIDLDQSLIDRAMDALSKLPSNVQGRIQIRREDMLASEVNEESRMRGSVRSHEGRIDELTLLDDATAVYLFLLPKALVKLKKLLDKLVERRRSEGRRFQVVANMFQVRGWTPSSVDYNPRSESPVYHYTFD